MFGGSIRTRLVLTFVALVLLIGAGVMYMIERQLADDLVSALDTRMSNQGQEIAKLVTGAGHPSSLALKLAAATGARITIVGGDGLIQSDTIEPEMTGRPVGDSPEIAYVRKYRGIGRAIRQLHPDEPPQYLVAVPGSLERVIRLAIPLDDIIETRSRMRNRLLVAAGGGLIGALILSYVLIRALTRPLQSMTQTAERLATGDYNATAPTDAAGELGVLARGMMKMAAEIKARVGEITEQRDLLSAVFGELVEGVVVVDEQGEVVLRNAAARPLVGEDAPLSPELVALLERARAGEEADGELALVGREVRASARPISPNPGTKAGAIVVLYDVTRIRALEEVRREFLSNVAHELRTPVTSIGGYAETLIGMGDKPDPELSREFLETIHRNAQRISTLVSDLLVLDGLEARGEAVTERTTISLAQVATDAARTTRGAIPTADIEIAIDRDLRVLGTRDGLDHVIQNLVDNAVKYAKTKVTIEAAPLPDNPRRIRLAISDRGPGIPRGQEDRVFERFYRLDAGRSSDRGGSGLGLAIVKSQVEALGGTIRVEHADPGARFVVELDAAPSASQGVSS